MVINNFIRFSESIKAKEEKRVVSVTVRPSITDCSGEVYFTDLQLQEGDRLSGYAPHTETMLRNSPNLSQGLPAVHHHNGVVRSGDTIIIFNLGETSTALDCNIYPIQSMEAGSISLSQGAGSHKATFLSAVNAGDEFALKASTRQCLRNGSPTSKNGFYQYTAASDSKHQVQLEESKSARVYFEYKEMMEGEPRP